jgi:hypothetical protein
MLIFIPLLLWFLINTLDLGIATSLRDCQIYALPWGAKAMIYNYPIWLNLIHYCMWAIVVYLIVKNPCKTVQGKLVICLIFQTLHFLLIIFNIGIEAGSI